MCLWKVVQWWLIVSIALKIVVFCNLLISKITDGVKCAKGLFIWLAKIYEYDIAPTHFLTLRHYSFNSVPRHHK
jgi:hypothetical protein